MEHLTASPDLAALPAGLRPLLAKALEKDRELRLKSVSDLAQGLEQFLRGENPTLVAGGSRERFQVRKPRFAIGQHPSPNANETRSVWRFLVREMNWSISGITWGSSFVPR